MEPISPDPVTCYRVTPMTSCLRARRRRSRELSLVRVPAIDAEARALAVEPREERQLLRVVGEPVDRVGERRAAQRVPDFEVALAAGHLSDVTPRRGGVVAIG